MTVAELISILSMVSDPEEVNVFVNHERFEIHPPEVFLSDGNKDLPACVIIVPAETTTLEDAEERSYWQRFQKASSL
jgi:hypothetical protein